MRISSLTFSQPNGEQIFSTVSFRLKPGLHCLVGDNGSGKSTLLKLIGGLLEPDDGEIRLEGIATYISFASRAEKLYAYRCFLEKTLGPRTLSEDIDGYRQAGNRDHLLLSQQLPSEVEFQGLSAGESTALLLSLALKGVFDWILLDEPTSHLPKDQSEIFLERLFRCERSALIATHDPNLLKRFYSFIHLHSKGIKIYEGSFDEFIRASTAATDAEQRKVHRALAEVKHASLRKQQEYEKIDGAKSSGKKKSAKEGIDPVQRGMRREKAANGSRRRLASIKRRFEQLTRHSEAIRENHRDEPPVAFDLSEKPVPNGRLLIRCNNLNFFLNANKASLWSEPLSFSVMGPERVLLRGPSGSGKSLLLHYLSEELEFASPITATGSIERFVHSVYLDEELSLLDQDLTVSAQLRVSSSSFSETEVRTRAARLGFRQESGKKRVAWLSTGERMRLALATLSTGVDAPQLILLDEPSEGLDRKSLDAVVRSLAAFPGAIVLVSNSDVFVEKLGVTREMLLKRP